MYAGYTLDILTIVDFFFQKMKWELVDMGSLNGTLLNSQPINHLDPGKRQWSNPIELANGDIITLGMTSKVIVSNPFLSIFQIRLLL